MVGIRENNHDDSIRKVGLWRQGPSLEPRVSRLAVDAPRGMRTTHPPNVYTASQPEKPLPPPPPHQGDHPITDVGDRSPRQIGRPSPRDSAPTVQPIPNRDGTDHYISWASQEAFGRKTRPATIAELAEKSREDLWDPNKSFEYWLRTAELARESGKRYAENMDYERSFVQLARAASIILEKMPTHKDYHPLLTTDQRNNLVLVSISLFPRDSTSPTFVLVAFGCPVWCSALLQFPVIPQAPTQPSVNGPDRIRSSANRGKSGRAFQHRRSDRFPDQGI